MTHRSPFATGRHLAASRTLAGITQAELAALAGLHTNSVKRLEAMKAIDGSPHSLHLIGDALRKKGIIVQQWPTARVRITDH